MQNDLADSNWWLEGKGNSAMQRGAGDWIRKRSFEYRNVRNLLFLAKYSYQQHRYCRDIRFVHLFKGSVVNSTYV